MSNLDQIINEAWENKDQINQNSDQKIKDAINKIIENLDSGKIKWQKK